MEEDLGLSEAQKGLLAEHKIKQKEEARERRAVVRATREALREALGKAELETEKIDQLHAELKALHAEAADHRLEGMLGVREILTPDQFTAFMALKGERGRHMSRGCGPCGQAIE
jgi:Spy/CpxP family protein refolding chaperone